MTRMWRLGLLVLLFGCSHADEPPPPAGTSGGGGASASVGVGSGGGGGMGPKHVVVPATKGTMMLPFDVAAKGSGKKAIGAIDIAGGAGTVVIEGQQLAAVSYRKQPFGAYTLYQTLAARSDALFVVWLYCQGGKLVDLYWEGTDGSPVAEDHASGSCVEGSGSALAAVAFPALDFAPPPLLGKYTVTGEKVSITPKEPGTVDLGSGPLTVLAFNDVDCTSCGSPGWREIHSLLWDQPKSRACFAIFYLLGAGKQVQVTYSLTLPDLSDPAGVTFLNATYSIQ